MNHLSSNFDGEDHAAVPRMLLCVLLTLFLVGAALWVQEKFPGTLIAVSLYKAHLLALGGWGGYWLDRALFPYARPHECLLPELDERGEEDAKVELVAATAFGQMMLRRAIIVAACLICVGLGA